MSRNYSNVAVQTALTSGISDSDSTLGVGSVTGYPTAPFTIIVDPGLVTEELVEVGNISGSSFTSCTRGVDGTPAQSHDSGAVVVHGTSARDFREPNDHVSATTSVHGITNTASLVTLTGSQTLTNKTLTSPALNSPTISGTLTSATLATPTITTPAITGGTWSGGTFSTATLSAPTIADFTNASHTHTGAASGGAIDSGLSLGFYDSGGGTVGPFTSTSLIQIGSSQFTLNAPSSWPSWASRIVYHAQVTAHTDASDASHLLQAGIRVDSTDLDLFNVNCPDPSGTTQISTIATLPSSGAHTIKFMGKMAFGGEGCNIGAVLMWATLI